MTLKTIGLLLIVLAPGSLARAQQPPTPAQQNVQQTITLFFEALSDRDSVKLKKYCTPSLMLIEYGQVWNLDTLLRKAIVQNTAADFKRTNSIDFIHVATDKNMATATYHLRSTITKEGKQTALHWLETVVAVKEKKRWKIRTLHSTRLERS